MKKIKEYWIIILLILFVVGGLFYWYELRPTKILKECSKWKELSFYDAGATKLGDNWWRKPYDYEIKSCLQEHGLINSNYLK